MNLATKVLIAIVLVILTGLGLSTYAPEVFAPLSQYVLVPIGSLFVKTIKMVVIPLVFLSVVTSVAGTGSLKKLGKMGGKTVMFFIVTTMIACTTGLLLASAIGPGKNVTIPENMKAVQSGGHGEEQATSQADGHGSSSVEPGTLPSFTESLLNIVPDNPIAAMSEGNMLQVLTFAIILGITMIVMGEKVTSVRVVMNRLTT